MAQRAAEIRLALALLMSVFLAHAAAQMGCTTAIVSLAPCLSYIVGNSSIPSSTCCSQLATIAQTQAPCLCTVLNGGTSLGIPINQTRALALPGACKVQTPPPSRCNAVAAGAPAMSPSETPSAPANPSPKTPSTPSGTTPTTPATPSVPTAGGGSKTVPSTTGQSSDGSSNRSMRSLMVSILFLAACASMANL